nr:hypothetical protein 13 [Alphaproteobacteria bacterium]
MPLESALFGIEANPELVVVASMQMILVAAVLGDNDQSSPLAIQMTTLDALKAIYRRQEFITDAELEVAVSKAFDHLTSEEVVA